MPIASYAPGADLVFACVIVLSVLLDRVKPLTLKDPRSPEFTIEACQSFHDVARFIHAFVDSPRCAEVYNLGGGRANSCSIVEAFDLVQRHTGRRQRHAYLDGARTGDHVCYYSDLRRMQEHYPGWSLTRSLDDIVSEIVAAWQERLGVKRA